MEWDPDSVAARIDNTFLKININRGVLEDFIHKSIKYRFRGIVVSPYLVKVIKPYIPINGPRLVSVVSFPFGQTDISVKLTEATYCIDSGVDELDIVLNMVPLIYWDLDNFRREVEGIYRGIKVEYPDITIKYIVEVTMIDKNKLSKAIDIINQYPPEYLKTSTGYGPRGTIPEDVKYIRERLDGDIGIKASGGIKSFNQFIKLVNMGADIIGSSSGFKIVDEVSGER